MRARRDLSRRAFSRASQYRSGRAADRPPGRSTPGIREPCWRPSPTIDPGCCRGQHHPRRRRHDRGSSRARTARAVRMPAAGAFGPRGAAGAYDPPALGSLRARPRGRRVQAGQEPAHQRPRQRTGMPGGRRRRNRGADGGALRRAARGCATARLAVDGGRRGARRARRGGRRDRDRRRFHRGAGRARGRPHCRGCEGAAAAGDPPGRSGVR